MLPPQVITLERQGPVMPDPIPPAARRYGLTLLIVPLVLVSTLIPSSDAQGTSNALGTPDAQITWHGAGDEVVILDPSKVYFGKPKSFTNPAVIKRMKVYKEIPAYKRIKDEKLNPSDPEYHFLIAEASKVFRANVKKVATAKHYDLVAEVRAIAATGRVLPDITKDVIKKVKGTP